jgi:membrane glycosyltransferase
MNNPILIRVFALTAALALSATAGWLFIGFTEIGGLNALDVVRAALIVVSGFWLVWGSAAALMGLFVPRRKLDFDPRLPPKGMTAILVPIYNEDPAMTFSRIAAMNRSLNALGIEERFHIVILSDTTSLEVAAQEVVWFEQLLREVGSAGRIFYRRREKNVGKKAGNIEDFISRSGGAYDYALILDADSLMEGATMGEMARRMDADPGLGLLQTVPAIINGRSFFGRSMQFSAAYLSPIFARGAALMQGNEGPYWGHNAIVRVSAFAANCGLPVLSGPPPHGGHILSHDYVEAALLSRAGWKVHLDPDLQGSYEEGPENLIEYAKRDRRWCQGNLQHRRLLLAPGLRWWSRFTFLQGIMAYMASPLWLVLLAASIGSAMLPEPVFFRKISDAGILGLAIGVALILILPKVLILLRGMIDGTNKQFGGTPRVIASVLAEIAFSTMLAPVLLLLQSRSVFQVLFGLDGGWPATRRSENWLDLRDAFAASWWIVVIGATVMAATLVFAPHIAVWVAPAMLPAILAPLMISASSHARGDKGIPAVFATPSEITPSPVILEQKRILSAWTAQGSVEPVQASVRAPLHVPA